MTPGRRAAQRISAEAVERREAADDRDLSQLGDGPFDVLTHLSRFQRVDSRTLRADMSAVFELAAHVRAEVDRAELAAFGMGNRIGMSLAEIGEVAGLAGRQAAYAHRKGLLRRVSRYEQDSAISDARETESAGGGGDPAEFRAVSRELARRTLLVAPDLEDAAMSVQDDLARWREGEPSVELVDDVRSLLCDLEDRGVSGPLGELSQRAAALLPHP